jgi:transcriptional regulator with XRE-family HTH domain
MVNTENGDASLITKWREELRLSTNQLAKLAGIANSYLLLLESGKIKKPGRDKLVAIGLALNKGVNEIDELLESWGMEPLESRSTDIGLFVGAAENKGVGYTYITNFGINSTACILALEMMPGDAKLVTSGYPHVASIHVPYFDRYFFKIRRQFSKKIPYSSLETDIIWAIQKERHTVFLKKVEKYNIEHLICRKCFSEYMGKIKSELDQKDLSDNINNDIVNKDIFTSYIRDLIRIIRNTKYDLYFVEYCPCYDFFIANNELTKNQAMIFGGRFSSHDKDDRFGNPENNEVEYSSVSSTLESKRLNRILTDSKDLITLFSNEFENLKTSCVTKSKEETITHIFSVLNEHGFNID